MAKQKKQAARPSSSGLLIFIAAFIGALVLFGAGGVIWWKATQPTLPVLDPNTQTNETTAPPKAARYDADDRFSFAVYITDDEGELQSLSLVLFEPDRDRIDVAALPKDLALSADDTQNTAANIFQKNGPDGTQLALNRYLSTTVDYYVQLSYSQVWRYFDTLGENLLVSLSKDVDETAEDGSFSLHLAAGEHALSSKQVANFLRCTGWQGGRRERADMHAMIVQAYLHQFLTDDYDLQAEHEKLLAMSTTNFVQKRFHSLSSPLNYFASINQGELCHVIKADGLFDGAGTTLHFNPSSAMFTAIQDALKPHE